MMKIEKFHTIGHIKTEKKKGNDIPIIKIDRSVPNENIKIEN